MGHPAWTDYEKGLIKDTIIDYREAGKQDQSALSALIRNMLHRNAKDVREAFREAVRELDYGGTTIIHEITDQVVVEMVGQIDETISKLEQIQEELQRLRQSEVDLNTILDAVRQIQ